jgi:hypothetical protein
MVGGGVRRVDWAFVFDLHDAVLPLWSAYCASNFYNHCPLTNAAASFSPAVPNYIPRLWCTRPANTAMDYTERLIGYHGGTIALTEEARRVAELHFCNGLDEQAHFFISLVDRAIVVSRVL